MTYRVTKRMVEGAFTRLHRAMEWPNLSPWTEGKANVGAAYLEETGFGWGVAIMSNESGGVSCPFPTWQSKPEAFHTMCAMADAVERFKDGSTKR